MADDTKKLSSPKPDVAKDITLLLTQAEAEIKRVIVQALVGDTEKKQIESEVKQIIQSTVSQITNKSLAATAKRALTQNAQKWFFTYDSNLKILGTKLAKQIVTNGKRGNQLYQGEIYQIALDELKNATPSPDNKSPTSTNQPNAARILDRIRPYQTFGDRAMILIEDYQRKVNEQIKALAASGTSATRLVNSKVQVVNLRNLAESAIRYEANMRDVQNLKNGGVKLVWISTHANCSKRCEEWQGRLYSLDGSSGIVEGHKYEPLENAMRGTNGDGNGCIAGYNCRHRIIEWRPNSLTPREFSSATIDTQRKLDQSMRRREATIRNLKMQELLLRANNEPEAADKLNARWKRATVRYRQTALRGGTNYYNWRCQIFESEISPPNQK